MGLRIIRLCGALPERGVGKVIGNQLIRSGTSIGANYRAACRAKSRKDMINKLCMVEEEADESLYWLELLMEGSVVPKQKLAALYKETNEILSMTVASIKRLKGSPRELKSKIAGSNLAR